MFFSVGVCLPENDQTAFGLVVPALCNESYGCLSAADTEAEMAARAREAILLIVEQMAEDSVDLSTLHDAGTLRYKKDPQWVDYSEWFAVDVDISRFSGKPLRINISLPDTLLACIDNRVKENPAAYRDRSHFLAQAARHELSAHQK
ncbi:type II toxin-antitoxin system HicB family antitoxin [Enterobacteriaceae bacterium BIT-l23]|uniref:CopG family transcriptional regulator n=1 Tax=Jejubacter calystegiae TaxID=2579935 RepID=A0A4P8YPW3_9ENTR|nr:type II toxin-antitoxin system HicB family antitoxin [Jejubacter calystegiae]NUU67532.1 type II toxin-antitoxin system HicB family antitoxin [Enterobacteriaceae bacterium BIT-l23]QCT22196.1 CopG family transcriptional regulator [Jejubacter calystegiae]